MLGLRLLVALQEVYLNFIKKNWLKSSLKQRSLRMSQPKILLPKDKYVPLVLFGCVHIGHKNADLDMAKRYVEWVKKTGAYCLLLSDNFENAIPQKAHMMFDQVMEPQEQIDYGEELFGPIRKQIMGLVQGNHSNRTRKEAGLDMDRELAIRLGIRSRYNPNQGFTPLRVGRHYYSVAYRHGSGVGSNTFGNCLNLMRAFPTADICAASHTHETASDYKGILGRGEGQTSAAGSDADQYREFDGLSSLCRSSVLFTK
jgi:hypothetical protein